MRSKETVPVDDVHTAGQVDLIQFTHWLSEMRTEFAQTLRGTFLQGALPLPIQNNQRITSSPGSIAGYSLRNLDAANPATIQIYDHDTSGTLLLSIQLGAQESDQESFSPGPGFTDGLYVVVSGLSSGVEGSVWIRGTD